MTERDFDEFSTMLKTISDYFGKPLTPGVIAVYWQGLRDLEIGELRAALNAHAQNPDSGMFMPKIADIRKMVGGTTQDSALVAWSKVDRAVRVVGTYADVVFDDPIIHRVIRDMGGWIALGGKSEDEWPFVAKEFETRYRGFRMRSEVPPYEPVMIGIAGAQNRRLGMPVQQPRLIGDQSACQRVQIGGTDRPLLEIATAASHSSSIERQALTAS